MTMSLSAGSGCLGNRATGIPIQGVPAHREGGTVRHEWGTRRIGECLVLGGSRDSLVVSMGEFSPQGALKRDPC